MAKPVAERLRSLHEISMDLSREVDADSLCKRAVELCIAELGFDRIGIWFYDEQDPQTIVGTWGTDEHGQVRDERGIRLPRYTRNQPKELMDGSVPFVIVPGDQVFDDLLRVVGRSDKAIVPLWDGVRIVGELVADNLFTSRPITEEDGDVLWLFARTVAHLCALKRSEAALREALKAKALLLGELQHRTFNSFALMRSLIAIEADKAGGGELGEVLTKLKDRVTVLSSLYRELDMAATSEKVRLDGYLCRIGADLMKSYGAETRGIVLSCSVEPIHVDMRSAVPLGLIVNELITDCLKHAFPEGRHGTVTLGLKRREGTAVLSVSDDGIGLPAGFDASASRGLGFTLITTLCRQIGGSLEMSPAAGGAPGQGVGASFIISFKL